DGDDDAPRIVTGHDELGDRADDQAEDDHHENAPHGTPSLSGAWHRQSLRSAPSKIARSRSARNARSAGGHRDRGGLPRRARGSPVQAGVVVGEPATTGSTCHATLGSPSPS